MTKPRDPDPGKLLRDRSMPWPQDMEEVDILRVLVEKLEQDISFLNAGHARHTVQRDLDKNHINALVNHHEALVRQVGRVKGALLGVLGVTKREHRRHCKMNVSLADCNMCYFIGFLEDFMEDHRISVENLLETGTSKDRETFGKAISARRGQGEGLGG
jgi:hypothetical protein